MELLPEADKVVRTFLPVVLDAAGRPECARKLRSADPIRNVRNVIAAAIKLRSLTDFISVEDVDPRWELVIEDSLFWTEAAVWAAVRKNAREFSDCVKRATESMKGGLPLVH